VVEGDCGGECGEACDEADEREDVFAGLEDRLDALAEEVPAAAAFVLAP
jgi:hypothetical protein